MALVIRKVGSNYSATVTPPHCKVGLWSTDSPLDVETLIEKLKALGCHQTDIGDAFYEADPNWVESKK